EREGDGWLVASIEQEEEGKHQLDEKIVARPDADVESLHDEAMVEGAAADKVPEGVKISEIADLDFDGDARTAAMDISLADGRFAPDILEVAVRRAVAGWAEAVDGSDKPLEAVATPDAVGELLYPGDPNRKTRVVVRGPKVQHLR